MIDKIFLQEKIKHIAIIPDGNRRWAVSNGHPSFVGHKYGADTLVNSILWLKELGVRYVSYFLFSTENCRRTEKELDYLLSVLKGFSGNSFNILNNGGCRIRFIGDRNSHNMDQIRDYIEEIENRSKSNSDIDAIFCLNYSGKQEILRAARICIENKISAENLTAEIFEKNLYLPDVPAPDILIRTSGEQRISNYYLWQLSYSELFFVEKYWPDFSKEDLDLVVEQFLQRDRRYGK